jgi:hypothetical protein
MTAQDQKSFGSRSLIALALISVAEITLPGAIAHAEDCLAAPNFPAREGTRWYYRLDRATQHKCWYTRALDQPTQQVAASAKATLPGPAFAIPIPRPRPSAAGSALSLSGGDPGPFSSATKESGAPSVGGSTAETTSSIPKEFTSPKSGRPLDEPAQTAPPPIGAATDETTSAISETNQALRSPEANVEAIAAAPAAETPAGATTDKTSSPTSDIAAPQQGATSSEPNAQMAASRPNAAPPIIAPIDDAASSSIPENSATQLSTSSDFGSNGAEPAPDVFPAERQASLAVATVDARRIPLPPDPPADLVSYGRKMTALSDELIKYAGMYVRPFHLTLALVVVSVCMLYYIVFRYLPGGRTRNTIDHPEDDYVDDDWYNSPEFYRKLRQGAVLEKP